MDIHNAHSDHLTAAASVVGFIGVLMMCTAYVLLIIK